MARKEKTIKIEAKNRDQGKIFHIKEMDAESAEWWALRVLLALGKANPDLGNLFEMGAGMGALAIAGIKSFLQLHPEDARPLWNEMMTCVKIVRDARHPEHLSELLPDDIEEIATRLQIRSEVFTLHTGFSIPGRI